jgi:hypothetical protein
MVTFTINIPQMLAYIPAPWILWVMHTASISQVPYAAFHPIFFLHHSNVDRIYEKHVQMETPEECVSRTGRANVEAPSMGSMGSPIPRMLAIIVVVQSMNHHESMKYPSINPFINEWINGARIEDYIMD